MTEKMGLTKRQESDCDYSSGSSEDLGPMLGDNTRPFHTISEAENRDVALGASALLQAILRRSPLTAQMIGSLAAEDEVFSEQYSRGWTPLHLAVTLEVQDEKTPISSDSAPAFSAYDTARNLISRSPRVLLIKDKEDRTPYQLRLEQLRDSPQVRSLFSHDIQDDSRLLEQATANDPILSYIRVYCIRNFDKDNAIQALYRPGQEKSIDFSLVGIAVPVPDDHLSWLERHLLFESVLGQVILPSIKSTFLQSRTDTTNQVTTRQARSSTARCKTRRDAVRVFSWLRKRGVKKIIKVVVMDTNEQFHDDEAIENALAGFEVERWDWRRYDIPSNVIAKASSAVEDVTLYFSGNDAVLEDWGGAGGFRNETLFPELRRICVELDPDVSNEELRVTILHKLDRPNVAVAVGIDISSTSPAKIRDGIESLTKSFWRLHDDTFLRHDLPRIKIALINDGIDAMQPELANNIAAGNTFSHSPDCAPYFVSSTGHGTALARVIQRLYPQSSLYVAKVSFQTDGTNSVPQVDVVSFEKAISWATSCKVDMICLGFTQSFTEIYGALVVVEKHVREALNQGIAIFVPGSDTGRVDDLPRFIGTNTIGVMPLGGLSLRWGDLGSVDFLFDGFPEAVASEDGNGNLSHIASGSSVATAVACGFAALLLHLRRLLASADRRTFPHPPARFVKDVFQNMATGYPSKYVSVQQVLLDMVGNGKDEQAFREKVERYVRPYE